MMTNGELWRAASPHPTTASTDESTRALGPAPSSIDPHDYQEELCLPTQSHT